ncbi:MAG: alpha-amylase family protein [Prevotellaceae bacterium]|nr:alpha-amylase family protein [Candidatus Minthosoma caballi]
MEKIVIYQVFTRLFGANANKNVSNGSKKENGCGKMADFTSAALENIKKLGATHIWYTGVIEHATKTDYTQYGIAKDHPAVVKGNAGSPYAIKDYYDIDPDIATKVPERMKEFENLVKRTHKAELKMIIDFVPNHVARQYHSDTKPEGVRDLGEDDDITMSFNPQNNFYYIPNTKFSPSFSLKDEMMGEYVETPAKATGNDCFTQWAGQNDWYETVKLNYGVDYIGTHQLVFSPSTPSTWLKMRDILLFWASKGIDGFRCDMAEMVPCDFWGWVIPQVKEKYPDIIFIAEVYNPHEYRNYIYRGHFDYLYDKVGLYDTLRHVMGGGSATSITGSWQSVDDINCHMLNFLENHDEQRIASQFFAGNSEKGKPALLVSALMRTNPMMIYFGQELGEQGMYSEGFSGQDGRTTIFDYWTIDLIRRWRNNGKFDGSLLSKEEKALQSYYTKVLTLCNKEKAIREGAFFDIMYVNYNEGMNEHRQYAFLRKEGKELIIVIANFSDEIARSWVKIPAHAFECLDIPVSEEERECKDLLTGKKEKKALIPDGTIYVEIPANGGKVLKFKL